MGNCTGTSLPPGSEFEPLNVNGAKDITKAELEKSQKHPSAAANIRDTMQDAGCAMLLLNFLLSLPFLILAIAVVLFLAPTLILSLLPFYLICPQCVLKIAGIQVVDTHEPEWMLPAYKTDLPTRLQGVFYMRLNPFSDDLLCFQRGHWNAATRSLQFSVRTASAMSFHKKFLVAAIMVGIQILCYRYELRVNEDFSEAAIRVKIWCITVPKFVANFNMTDVSAKADGSLWERHSFILGNPVPSYWAERVLNADGSKTPYFKHVLQEVEREQFAFA